MTEYKLNTYIEWTDEDRAKGECPVPDGSDVTMWFSGGQTERDDYPEGGWNWGEETDCDFITAYLIHSVPREPLVRWMVAGGPCHGFCYPSETDAKRAVAKHGGRVVKLVEEME